MSDDALRYQKRVARDLKRHLTALTTANLQFLEALDDIMRQPSSPDRGAKIAKLSNFLDMANDRARYNGLGINFRDDDKKAALLNAGRVAADQFAEILREHWSFDARQQHTHSWHSREDFIQDELPKLLAINIHERTDPARCRENKRGET
jgi:hypothetical protein